MAANKTVFILFLIPSGLERLLGSLPINACCKAAAYDSFSPAQTRPSPTQAKIGVRYGFPPLGNHQFCS
jgi:hypothetical protein